MLIKLLTLGRIVVLLFSIAFASHSFAAPTVSSTTGTPGDGQTLVITGSGFGSHANYNNISDTWHGKTFLNFRFNDFDNGVLLSHGFVFTDNPGGWVAKSGGRANSAFYASKFYNGNRLGGLAGVQAGATGQWFISFWFMMPPNNQSGKFFRLWGSAGDFSNFYLSTGCTNRMIRGARANSNAVSIWGSPDSFQDNTWHRVDVYANVSTTNVTVYMDGKLQWVAPGWVDSTYLPATGHTIDVGHMIDGPNDPITGSKCPDFEGSYNFDDVFYDFTQARVEIGDTPTWTGSHHREIQLPIAWTDSQITVVLNQGSFSNLSNKFLYVVDSNGNVNQNGYLLCQNCPVPPNATIK